MTDAIKKTADVSPQIFRVDLSPDQAILTACSLATTNAANGGGSSCRPAGCKNFTGLGAGDSGPRPS